MSAIDTMTDAQITDALNALRRIAQRGCTFARMGTDAECRAHRIGRPQAWCDPCLAADALNIPSHHEHIPECFTGYGCRGNA